MAKLDHCPAAVPDRAAEFLARIAVFDPDALPVEELRAELEAIPLAELLVVTQRRNVFHHLAVCELGKLIPSKYKTPEVFLTRDGQGYTLLHWLVSKSPEAIPKDLHKLEHYLVEDGRGTSILEVVHIWHAEGLLLPPYYAEATDFTKEERLAWIEALTPYGIPPEIHAKLLNTIEPTGTWREL